MAEQLGKMVVDHLITPESLQKKVMNEEFQKDVTLWLSEELQPVFTSDKTVNEWLDILQIPISSDRFNEWLEDWIAVKVKDTKIIVYV